MILAVGAVMDDGSCVQIKLHFYNKINNKYIFKIHISVIKLHLPFIETENALKALTPASTEQAVEGAVGVSKRW